MQQPVKWKVVSYQESADGGLTWGAETQTKPTWLTNLSTESGDGGTAAESGTATLTTDIIDKLAPRNKALKEATALGSAGSPYDLSTKGGSASRNTANSYVISAPGYYKIPLVYGNAITNGNDNPSSYKTTHSGTYILTNFKDHAGVNIASPYINVQNGSDPATQAGIVWTDQSGIIEASSLGIEGSGTNAFVHFRVPQDKIKNGNAVIAVKNASGTIMWSWHLWFAPQDVLNTTAVTNFQNKVYNFTNETLGFKYTAWTGTTYTAPRKVKVKVQQMTKNGTNYEEGVITITQNNGNVRQGYSTLYQFGRKDAFPGTETTPDGSFNKNGGNNMSIPNGIQHPEFFYNWGSSWTSNPPTGYSYYNLWSMDNTTTGFNDNAVVKTIYDPCPAGFKMPASNAFTGFTINGQNGGTMNVSGAWDNGWNFNNKISNPDATIYFPASGQRIVSNGSLGNVGNEGYYWLAVPYNAVTGCFLYFSRWGVDSQMHDGRSYAYPVRPVLDE